MQARHLFQFFKCHQDRVIDEYVFEHLYHFALTLLPDQIRDLFETGIIHSEALNKKFECHYNNKHFTIDLPNHGSLHELIDVPFKRYFTRMAMAASVLGELLKHLNNNEFAEFLNHHSDIAHVSRHSGLTQTSPPVHIIMYIERMKHSSMSKADVKQLLQSERLYADYQATFITEPNLEVANIVFPSKKK
jgi:hypothetical protein